MNVTTKLNITKNEYVFSGMIIFLPVIPLNARIRVINQKSNNTSVLVSVTSLPNGQPPQPLPPKVWADTAIPRGIPPIKEQTNVRRTNNTDCLRFPFPLATSIEENIAKIPKKIVANIRKIWVTKTG